MLMLDFVSKRYGTIPSKLMREGNTFDLYIADLAASYQRFITDKETARHSKQPLTPPKLSQEQLLAMMAVSKGMKNDNQTKG